MTDDVFFSEEDIRPEKLMAELSGVMDIGHKREVLLGKKSDFVEIPCPACTGSKYQNEFTKNGFVYVRCADCGLVFNNPRPDREMLAEYYSDNPLYDFWNRKIFLETESVRNEKIVVPRVDRLIELCRTNDISGGTLLEIGSGFGTFAMEARSRKLFNRIVAVEPTEALAGTCVERGLETIDRPYEEIDPDTIEADVIASFEVIEHLFAPDNFITFCSQALRTGGLLVLSFPNMDGFDTALLREKSGSVGGEHINMFNGESMSRLLERFGFRIVALETPGSLDTALVRKAVLDGRFDLAGCTWLEEILLHGWEKIGRPFQEFLRDNGLSSHMVISAVLE